MSERCGGRPCSPVLRSWSDFKTERRGCKTEEVPLSILAKERAGAGTESRGPNKLRLVLVYHLVVSFILVHAVFSVSQIVSEFHSTCALRATGTCMCSICPIHPSIEATKQQPQPQPYYCQQVHSNPSLVLQLREFRVPLHGFERQQVDQLVVVFQRLQQPRLVLVCLLRQAQVTRFQLRHSLHVHWHLIQVRRVHEPLKLRDLLQLLASCLQITAFGFNDPLLHFQRHCVCWHGWPGPIAQPRANVHQPDLENFHVVHFQRVQLVVQLLCPRRERQSARDVFVVSALSVRTRV